MTLNYWLFDPSLYVQTFLFFENYISTNYRCPVIQCMLTPYLSAFDFGILQFEISNLMNWIFPSLNWLFLPGIACKIQYFKLQNFKNWVQINRRWECCRKCLKPHCKCFDHKNYRIFWVPCRENLQLSFEKRPPHRLELLE